LWSSWLKLNAAGRWLAVQGGYINIRPGDGAAPLRIILSEERNAFGTNLGLPVTSTEVSRERNSPGPAAPPQDSLEQLARLVDPEIPDYLYAGGAT
jgi:hypothetical protein